MMPAMTIGEFGAWRRLQIRPGRGSASGRPASTSARSSSTRRAHLRGYELYSPDAKQARDFYTKLLGATANPMPGGLEYYVLQHGDEQLAGIMQIDPSWGDFRPQWMVYFGVKNATTRSLPCRSRVARP